MELHQLNRLDPADARKAFRDCCGSDAWVTEMIARRPFDTEDDLIETAGTIWRALDPSDQEEAFAAHPRIGESARGDDRHSRWSDTEQAAIADSSAEILDRLAECNREYEAIFGRVYLVFATGKSADEMLSLCQSRLANEPETEQGIAAQEQEKITDLRLRKLVGID